MTNDHLIQLIETLKADIVNSLLANGVSAAGQTVRQLSVTTDGNSVQLQLPGYLQLLETGRGPTSPNAVTADPPMIQRIQHWCREKGIPDKAAWAIKKSIDKKGYNGKQGILSEPLGDDNINLRLTSVMENIAIDLGKIILDSLP
jgi:hypothetical protein